MYVWDSGAEVSRVRRELGAWGLMVIHKSSGHEEILENVCGAFPLEEEVRMAENTGSCGASFGATINMGRYESRRADCWVTLPCTEDTADDVYQKCHDFVAKKVEGKIQQFIEEREASDS
jgi:hypothetical protein